MEAVSDFNRPEFPSTLLGEPIRHPRPPAPPADAESPLSWPESASYSATVLLTYEVPVAFEVNAGEDPKTIAVDQAVEMVGAGAMTLIHTEIQRFASHPSPGQESGS